MNYTEDPAAPAVVNVATTPSQRTGGSLQVLIQRLHAAVRGFCPTLEEWQAAVELLPTVEEEPNLIETPTRPVSLARERL